MPRSEHPAFSVEWLAHVFDLGRPRVAVHAGGGQKHPLGVLRLETAQGCFAVKRCAHEPKPGALAIESYRLCSGVSHAAAAPDERGEAVCGVPVGWEPRLGPGVCLGGRGGI